MTDEAPVAWKKPKYLWEDTDRHGTIRRYFCKTDKPKIRIYPDPDTKEFWDAYRLAMDGIALERVRKAEHIELARPGTFRWLGEQYFASGEFLGLDLSTRATRRNVMASCWAEPYEPGSPKTLGNCALKDFSAAAVRMLRDRKRAVPEAANGRLKTIRGLFKWALANDDIVSRFPIAANPARDVPTLKTSSEGFHTWSIEEVEKFEAFHTAGSTARLALAFLMFTGQRKSDVIRFGRQHVKDGYIHFTQHKNRNRKAVHLVLPVLPVLQAAIESGPTGQLTFIVNEYGKPFSEGGFGNRMRKWCDDAGLKGCSAHGLRKAGACIAAENGATERQLMAIFGWSDPDMAAHYTKKAGQKKMATDSMHLIIPKRKKAEAPLPLFERLASG